MGENKMLRASALQIIGAVLLALLLLVGSIYAGLSLDNRSKLECAERDVLTLQKDMTYIQKDYNSLREEVLPELKVIRNDMADIKKSIAVLERGK